MSEIRYIDRPPRIQPDLPQAVVEIPAPPSKEARPAPIWQTALPAVTILGYLLVSIFGRGRSLLLMIPMGLSVVASVALSFYSARQNKREQEEQKAAYAEHLIEMRREMLRQHDMQRRFYFFNYPDSESALQIAVQAHKHAFSPNESTHTSSRLWERRTDDTDFGTIRIGIGTRPSTVQYELSEGGSVDDPQVRDALRLQQDSLYVTEVPITISLRNGAAQKDQGVFPPRHSIGIAANDPRSIYPFVGSLVSHFAIFQAPTDAQIRVLGTDKARRFWEWVAELPHCHGMACFESEIDREKERSDSDVYAFLKDLRQLLDERKLRLQDDSNTLDVTLPFLLVLVDLFSVTSDKSRLVDLEMDPGISLIMNQGPALGTAIIFLVPNTNKIPGGCESVINLAIEEADKDVSLDTAAKVNFRYAETGINTPRYLGVADTIPSVDFLKQLAQELESLAVRKSYGADLPRSVHMLDMLGQKTMEGLRELTRANWVNSRLAKNGEWLRVALGMLSGGDYRTLKFSADADGVHGIVAGSTGSGKSELLMTMILGLAVNYDPSIINFVLVDFKGGGAFKPLEKLPHVVDVVTNLGESAVERMFAAITAELNRRQAVNTSTESKHIVHYRERGLHLPDDKGNFGQPVIIKERTFYTAPYPHLFVFIDEFAEMIAANPEYKAQLNSITRLGRALGVTLILAAQRPTGVTDQMRANIKFRIALRVETREESSEVLRRPDAAYLPTGIPGRGYLQVGNENVELMQVAWSGADYSSGPAQTRPDVIWERWNRGEGYGPGNKSVEDELPKVYEEMVKMMASLAEEVSLPQDKPWPDFLPHKMSLQTPIDARYLETEGDFTETGESARENQDSTVTMLNPAIEAWISNSPAFWSGIDWREQAMRAVVGLIDNPYQSEQQFLYLNFKRGHAVIFGASGWGKTTFLRTTLITLATTHSPAELHAYILDFGGRQLSLFHELPHVGAIITPDEEERIRRLLRKLDSVLEQRKKLLSEKGESDLYRYNYNHPDTRLPAILVLIDNFAEFRESFEGLVPQLISIVRESRAYGIHFIVSAELPNALSGKLYSLLTERLTFKLSDPTEYGGIVGRTSGTIDDLPGRGYVKVERRTLEFQAAMPVGTVADLENQLENQRLIELVRTMAERAYYVPEHARASQITTLPTSIALKDILPSGTILPRVTGHIRPIIGIDDLNLEHWSLDMYTDGPHCMVIGPPNAGKTTFLRTLVLSLACSYTPDEVMIILIDFQQRLFNYGGNRSLSDLPHVVETYSNSDRSNQLAERLRLECQELTQTRRKIFVIIDNYESFGEDVGDQKGVMPLFSGLAREYGTMGLHFIICGSPDITRSPDALRKQVQAPRFGIALDVESAGRLNGRVPRSLTLEELPTGRGFVVKSGRTIMVQFATPYVEINSISSALDEWVEEVQNRYPGQKSMWKQEPKMTQEGEDKKTYKTVQVPENPRPGRTFTPEKKQEEGSETDVYVPLSSIPDNLNIADLRSQIEAKAGFSVESFGPVDIVNMAIGLRIIDTPTKHKT